jgi:hypothetical protein
MQRSAATGPRDAAERSPAARHVSVAKRAELGFATAFTQQVGIGVPLICDAMYPCSNPELIAKRLLRGRRTKHLMRALYALAPAAQARGARRRRLARVLAGGQERRRRTRDRAGGRDRPPLRAGGRVRRRRARGR